MPREPGSTQTEVGKGDSTQVARLKNEISTLKSQLRTSVSAPEPLEVKYHTEDSEEAALYGKVGGRVVTVVKKNPNHPLAAGKRYGFAETKAELEKMVQARKEAGLL